MRKNKPASAVPAGGLFFLILFAATKRMKAAGLAIAPAVWGPLLLLFVSALFQHWL